MSNIYDQHRAAFGNVSAYVILRGRNVVGNVAFKFPRDGAGRLYAYVHFHGAPMVRGFASGYGYDKRTAAVEDAFKKIDPANLDAYHANSTRAEYARFVNAIDGAKDGQDWGRSLENAGYTVAQAV
mgnify:CR=1 FL=1